MIFTRLSRTMKVTDIINAIFSKVNSIFHIIICWYCTQIERLYLRSIGVELSSNVVFRGWTSFYRANHSIIKIGKGVRFNSNQYYNHIGLNHKCVFCTHRTNAKITVGNNCGISSSTINCWDSITIGNNVLIGANCVIMDADFHLDDSRSGKPQPIKIGNNVWLGANVVVMKGVNIGNNCVIGMNSVVTSEIPSNSVAVGSPAKVIRMLSSY